VRQNTFSLDNPTLSERDYTVSLDYPGAATLSEAQETLAIKMLALLGTTLQRHSAPLCAARVIERTADGLRARVVGVDDSEITIIGSISAHIGDEFAVVKVRNPTV
jgi:hypothetical protein